MKTSPAMVTHAVILCRNAPRACESCDTGRASSNDCESDKVHGSSGTRRPDGDGPHHRAGAAKDAQRQDDRARQADVIARHPVEHEVLNLVDAVLSQVVVMHAEGEIRQRVGGRGVGTGSVNGLSSATSTTVRAARYSWASTESPGPCE